MNSNGEFELAGNAEARELFEKITCHTEKDDNYITLSEKLVFSASCVHSAYHIKIDPETGEFKVCRDPKQKHACRCKCSGGVRAPLECFIGYPYGCSDYSPREKER